MRTPTLPFGRLGGPCSCSAGCFTNLRVPPAARLPDDHQPGEGAPHAVPLPRGWGWLGVPGGPESPIRIHNRPQRMGGPSEELLLWLYTSVGCTNIETPNGGAPKSQNYKFNRLQHKHRPLNAPKTSKPYKREPNSPNAKMSGPGSINVARSDPQRQHEIYNE